MAIRLFVIHWNAAEVRELAQELSEKGWAVADVEAQDGAAALRSIRQTQPDAVLIYLRRSPSHGRETARALSDSPSTRDIPIIFVDGSGHGLAKARDHVPHAIFTTHDALEQAVSAIG